MRLINCERERVIASVAAEMEAGIAARESRQWDWADYAALGLLAQRIAIFGHDETPVADALRDLEFDLEDEKFRAALADAIRGSG